MFRLGGLLLAAFLLLPTAAAAAASGGFDVQGGVSLPEGADSSLQPRLLFQPDAASVGSLLARFPRVTVHSYEVAGTSVDASPMPANFVSPPREEEVVLTSADILLDGAAAPGFLGIYPKEGASAAFAAAAPVSWTSRDQTVVSTIEGPAQGDDPYASRYYYRQTLEDTHLYADAVGTLRYEGPGIVKIIGLDLVARSDQGERRFDTGTVRQGWPGAETYTTRWVVLEFAAGAVEAQATTPWNLASGTASSTWEGVARFDAIEGALTDARARYLPTDAPAHVEGRFATTLTPEPLGRIHVDLEGDLASTSLRVQSLPLAARLANDGGSSALLLALGVALAAGGAGFTGGWYAAWRRRPKPVAALPAPAAVPAAPFTAEDCCDAGAKAASEEDWAGAAKWFGRAHALAPTSARICGDLAFSLSQIGDVDGALRLYAQASRMSEDGEADFNGALAALHADRPAEDVEAWLERALERSPMLVMPLESDSDFRILKGRPRYEEAVRRAWARLGTRA